MKLTPYVNSLIIAQRARYETALRDIRDVVGLDYEYLHNPEDAQHRFKQILDLVNNTLLSTPKRRKNLQHPPKKILP